MQKILMFPIRLREPFAWRIVGVKVEMFTASLMVASFAVVFSAQQIGMFGFGLAGGAILLMFAVFVAVTLTSMDPPKPGITLKERTKMGLLTQGIRHPQWSNEGRWPTPIRERSDNIVICRNGDVWVNFLCDGAVFSSHQPESIDVCQRLNGELFAALAALADRGVIAEVHVIGPKVLVRPSTIINRCIEYVPDWAEHEHTKYRNARDGLINLHNQYVSGQRKSYERPFWLAVRIGSTDQTRFESLLDAAGLGSGGGGLDLKSARDRERQVRAVIPATFRPQRTSPPHLEWILERHALRGLPSVPPLPSGNDLKATMLRGNKFFRHVTVTAGGEAESLADMFIERVAATAGTSARRLRRIFRDGIGRRYRSLRYETAIAVHSPHARSPEFPDGPTSYQSVLTLASGPSVDGSLAIHKMTGIVDGFTGLDGDVSIRITYEQLAGSALAKKFGKASRRLAADDRELSQSQFDAAEFAVKDAQLAGLYRHSRSGNIMAHASVTFAFGDANYESLQAKVRALTAELAGTHEEEGFQLYPYPGAQTELWRSMLPCTSAPPVVQDTALLTTPALLGAAMPLRRQLLGDPYGWPIGESLENSLGQIVYTDLLTVTQGGDGSMFLSGEPSTGKSSLAKVLQGAVHDLSGTVWAADPVGETQVYASDFPDSLIFDLTDPAASLDLLKCLPDSLSSAAWLNVWCPLLGVQEHSEEYERLATVIAPDYRAINHSPTSGTAGLTSTRLVADHIAASGGDVSKSLTRRFGAVKNLAAAACLIDPVVKGKIQDLPALRAGRSRFVVFNTSAYVLRDDDKDKVATKRLATAVFGAIGALAHHQFNASAALNMFSLDEAHAADAPVVTRSIIGDTTRAGRKNNNLVLVATQDPDDIADGLKFVTRRGAFRQRNADIAVAALRKTHITPTAEAVRIMTTEISPLADDLVTPVPGREGELFWFDGRRAGRMQTFLPLLERRARLADTRPDKLIRPSDLPAQPGPAHAR